MVSSSGKEHVGQFFPLFYFSVLLFQYFILPFVYTVGQVSFTYFLITTLRKYYYINKPSSVNSHFMRLTSTGLASRNIVHKTILRCIDLSFYILCKSRGSIKNTSIYVCGQIYLDSSLPGGLDQRSRPQHFHAS